MLLRGDVKGACDYALNNASSLEELGNLNEASNILKTLLELFETKNIKDNSCLEVVLEKLVSINIELQEINELIKNSIKLAKIKIELGKTGEAVQLLKTLDARFKLPTSVLKEMIDIYISISHFPNALRLIDRVLEKEKDAKLMQIAGDIQYSLGNFDKAIVYFEALTVLEQDNEYAKKKVEEIKRILSALDQSKKEEEKPLAEELKKIPTQEEKEPINVTQTQIPQEEKKQNIEQPTSSEKLEENVPTQTITPPIEQQLPKETLTEKEKPERINLEEIFVSSLNNMDEVSKTTINLFLKHILFTFQTQLQLKLKFVKILL